MKPGKIIIFFLSVFSLLLLIALVFPKEGISIGEKMDLQFMDVSFFFKGAPVPENIVTAGIINLKTVTDDPEYGSIDSVFIVRDTISHIINDSLIKARIDSICSTLQAIEFSVKGKEQLQKFFTLADHAGSAEKPLRILHYGDSQIENDRMTSLLRYRLQKVYGGTGCGLIPAVPLYFGNPTYREEIEGDWSRYTGFGKRDSTLKHRNYGAMNSYTEVPADSTEDKVSLRYEFYEGRRASRFSRMKIYLHSYTESGQLNIMVNDTITDVVTDVYEGFQVIEYHPEVAAGTIEIDFNLEQGGRIYGISFDSDAGIQVDNLAMRGSSGIEFRRQDSTFLKYMLGDLNPGLFLLQFGGNTVPYIKKTGFYKNSFKKELAYIMKLCPNAAIIVIGPADMSRKENGRFITWESVEPVRDALRTAALESGCAFWDMYEAMGGENSMHSFVLSDPPLAQKDYVHFTPKGANLMAEMFCNALMVEYSRYQAAIINP